MRVEVAIAGASFVGSTEPFSRKFLSVGALPEGLLGAPEVIDTGARRAEVATYVGIFVEYGGRLYE